MDHQSPGGQNGHENLKPHDPFADDERELADDFPAVEQGPDPDPGFYPRALRRIPRWIAATAIVSLPFVWHYGGALWGASFAVGAIGGYWNYIAICRVADRLTQTADPSAGSRRLTVRSMLRLLFMGMAVFVIIRFTHINFIAAFMGLFTPVAAVVIEILYELATRQS